MSRFSSFSSFFLSCSNFFVQLFSESFDVLFFQRLNILLKQEAEMMIWYCWFCSNYRFWFVVVMTGSIFTLGILHLFPFLLWHFHVVWFDRAANFGISIPPNKMGWEEFQKLRLREKKKRLKEIELKHAAVIVKSRSQNSDKREQ